MVTKSSGLYHTRYSHRTRSHVSHMQLSRLGTLLLIAFVDFRTRGASPPHASTSSSPSSFVSPRAPATVPGALFIFTCAVPRLPVAPTLLCVQFEIEKKREKDPESAAAGQRASSKPAPMLRCPTQPQCGRAPLRHHGRRESPPSAAPGVVVRCARGAPQVSRIEAASPVAATTAAAAAKAERGDARPSLAERLRLGSLLEDGLSYKEIFIVRSYEVGINKTATVETIANLLQVRSRARAVGSGSLLPTVRTCALWRPHFLA